jgi:hypothetical protein
MTAQNTLASPPQSLQAVAIAPAHAKKSDRSFALLQLPDSRLPPHPDLLVRSEELIIKHLPKVLQEQPNLIGSGNIPGSVGNTVELVFDSELGIASARARAFLSAWITFRRYRPAWEVADCSSNDIALWRAASPAFSCCFDSVDAWIRSYRHHESEDTLHALANGEIAEPVFGPVGGGRSGKIGEKAIYSEKALVTELAAQDPRRYGKAVGENSGLAITLNISVPDDAAKQAEIIDVDGEEVSA